MTFREAVRIRLSSQLSLKSQGHGRTLVDLGQGVYAVIRGLSLWIRTEAARHENSWTCIMEPEMKLIMKALRTTWNMFFPTRVDRKAVGKKQLHKTSRHMFLDPHALGP